jgi:hypothetical protein
MAAPGKGCYIKGNQILSLSTPSGFRADQEEITPQLPGSYLI